MVATRPHTMEAIEALGTEHERFEPVCGEVREAPLMGMRHGEIGSVFHIRIGVFVQANRLGRVHTSDTHPTSPLLLFTATVG